MSRFVRHAGLPALCAILVAGAGCARPATERGAVEQHEEAAASYKDGYGIRLNGSAAAFSGLQLSEVTVRDLAGSPGAMVVPEIAVLRTVRGAFVFVENGSWLLRSPVTTGRTDGEWVEIRDGLFEGDRVAVGGVDALWLAEIAAVNGGVGCADGH